MHRQSPIQEIDYGYPPLEPHLQGMTLLWITGVPLSALIQRFSWGRAWTLALYAFATGFIDAASWPMMVPNRFDFVETAFMTYLIYGPIYGRRRRCGGKINGGQTVRAGIAGLLQVGALLPSLLMGRLFTGGKSVTPWKSDSGIG